MYLNVLYVQWVSILWNEILESFRPFRRIFHRGWRTSVYRERKCILTLSVPLWNWLYVQCRSKVVKVVWRIQVYSTYGITSSVLKTKWFQLLFAWINHWALDLVMKSQSRFRPAHVVLILAYLLRLKRSWLGEFRWLCASRFAHLRLRVRFYVGSSQCDRTHSSCEVNALQKVVGFLHVLRISSTGKVNRVG